jgi:CheY-like chemotaxis protein
LKLHNRSARILLFLDIGMPKMNGYDACRQIRANESSKDTLLVALTGWGQESDRGKAKEAGFDDPVVKPVDVSTLIELLASSPPTQLARNARPSP